MARFMIVDAGNTGMNFSPILSITTYTSEDLIQNAKELSNFEYTSYTPEVMKQLEEFVQNAQPGEYFRVCKWKIVFRLKAEM